MMEHKAFLFDYERFERELRPILDEALATKDTGELVAFIQANLVDLRDPYEGGTLGPDWELLIEAQDVHQYGDFALTKYYDVRADIGLGSSWVRVQELVANAATPSGSPILGNTLGPKEEPFDPGKMGAYFQTAPQVCQNYGYLLELAKQTNSSELESALQMLGEGAKSQHGLYVTF